MLEYSIPLFIITKKYAEVVDIEDKPLSIGVAAKNVMAQTEIRGSDVCELFIGEIIRGCKAVSMQIVMGILMNKDREHVLNSVKGPLDQSNLAVVTSAHLVQTRVVNARLWATTRDTSIFGSHPDRCCRARAQNGHPDPLGYAQAASYVISNCLNGGFRVVATPHVSSVVLGQVVELGNRCGVWSKRLVQKLQHFSKYTVRQLSLPSPRIPQASRHLLTPDTLAFKRCRTARRSTTEFIGCLQWSCAASPMSSLAPDPNFTPARYPPRSLSRFSPPLRASRTGCRRWLDEDSSRSFLLPEESKRTAPVCELAVVRTNIVFVSITGKSSASFSHQMQPFGECQICVYVQFSKRVVSPVVSPCNV